jgi:hypothetical protein
MQSEQRAPLDDFGFFALVAGVIHGGQARSVADRAINVDLRAAGPGDQMVMVIANPAHVARRRYLHAVATKKRG